MPATLFVKKEGAYVAGASSSAKIKVAGAYVAGGSGGSKVEVVPVNTY